VATRTSSRSPDQAARAAASRRSFAPDVVGAQAVGVGRVDERHAGVERGVDRADRLLLVGPAVDRQRHGAEADRADGAVSERALLHEVLLRGVSGSGRCVPFRTVCRRAATST
jgi:hypothetical protein